MLQRIITLVTLLALVVCPLEGRGAPAVTPSPSPTVTSQSALDIALLHNSTLRVAEQQEKEALWAWKYAGALPPFSLAPSYFGGKSSNTYNGSTQDEYVTLSQTFGPINSIALAARAARRAYQSAQANTRLVRVTVTQNAKDAYYGLLAAQDQLAVARENFELANSLFHLAEVRFKEGAGPQMDVLNAQIQQSQSEQAVIQAEAALVSAQSTLLSILDYWPAKTEVKAAGTLELSPLQLVLDALLEYAEQKHPQIEVATRNLEQSKEQVRLARSQANPNPSIIYERDLKNTTIYSTNVVLSFPLDFAGQIRYAVREAQHSVLEKKAALDGAVTTVTNSVKSALKSYQAAVQNASVYQQKVLIPSEKLMKMTEIGFKEGALPYLQVLNAQQTLRTARVQYITLLQSGHQALDALEAAVGKTLEEPRS